MQEESPLRTAPKAYGASLQDAGDAKREQIEEGRLISDHVHMLISIPPKYGVAQVVGFIKGKSAIYIARVFQGRKKSFPGQSFWARGYFVSRWQRRKGHQGIHQEARSRRQTPGPTANVLTVATFRWLMVYNRFERSMFYQASGFAGGI